MPQSIDRKREHEKQLVAEMITLYCNKKHGTPKGERCAECAELEAYARSRADHCPFMETKTFCANCKVHCYKPDMREKIRELQQRLGITSLYVTHDQTEAFAVSDEVIVMVCRFFCTL